MKESFQASSLSPVEIHNFDNINITRRNYSEGYLKTVLSHTETEDYKCPSDCTISPTNVCSVMKRKRQHHVRSG